MSLLDSLSLGSSALLAQQAGIAVTGRNTANVNTPGYQRESIDFESQPGSPMLGGVTTGSAYRSSDDLLSAQERTQSGAGGYSSTLSTSLSSLESQLTGANNSDLIDSISGFFSDMSKLQGSPTDSALRGQVVTDAGTIAARFNDASASIASAQSDADKQVTTLAGQATQLAAQIATLNKSMATSNDPVLADQRDQAAQQLAALVGGQARVDADGQMRFVLDGGAVLVDGTRASTLTPVQSGGKVTLHAVDGTHDTDVSSQVTSGQIGGLFSFRDGVAAQAATDLDQLAYDFSTQLNAAHASNVGLDGSTGNNLFTAPATATGAAAAMAVNPAIVANTNKLATSSPGAGTNGDGGVSAMLALGTATVAAGGTSSFSDEAIRLIGAVGSAAQQASSDNDLQSARADTLASARDSVSGVSQEDEMAKLSQFQNGAEAAGKFISTVNDLLTTLLTDL